MEDRNAPATKGDLTDLESRLKGDLTDLESRLKGDLTDLESRLKGDLTDLESRLNENVANLNESIAILRSEMNHQYRELVERISDTQTEVLRAFYSFAQTNNKRVLEVEGNEAALRSRLGTLEDRVLEIEKRLNLPPAA
jgi:wobble nucleotide-excising tRNase